MPSGSGVPPEEGDTRMNKSINGKQSGRVCLLLLSLFCIYIYIPFWHDERFHKVLEKENHWIRFPMGKAGEVLMWDAREKKWKWIKP
jgi:hypothetical protein